MASRTALVGSATSAVLNWSADIPIADWDGIGDDSLEGSPPRVTKLYLNALGLDGTIPGELSGSNGPEGLYLHDNDLNGPIPAELGDLSNLTHLHLQEQRPDRRDTGGVGRPHSAERVAA